MASKRVVKPSERSLELDGDESYDDGPLPFHYAYAVTGSYEKAARCAGAKISGKPGPKRKQYNK